MVVICVYNKSKSKKNYKKIYLMVDKYRYGS